MTLQTFSEIITIDGQGQPAANATVQAYEPADTSFAHPLNAVDLNGIPLTLTSSSLYMLPDFRVDIDGLTVVIKSGDLPAREVLSLGGLTGGVTDAQTSAASAASAAAASATTASAAQAAAEAAASASATSAATAASVAATAVKTVNGVSPDGSGNVTVSSGGGGGEGGAVTSVAGKTGDVSLVKGDVGLSQVDNTSDASKPVSSATSTALAGKAATVHTHVVADVTGLQAALDSKAGLNAAVNASQVNAGTGVIDPAHLGTGSSITAKYLRGDGTWQTVEGGGGGGGAVDSVNGQTGDVVLTASDVSALAASTVFVASVAGRTGTVTLAKADVGLGSVDNTADSAKPLSSAATSALAAKADDSAVVKLTGAQTVAGVKTFSSAPVVPDASFTQAKVSGLVTALAGKVSVSSDSPVSTIKFWFGAAGDIPEPGDQDADTAYFGW